MYEFTSIDGASTSVAKLQHIGIPFMTAPNPYYDIVKEYRKYSKYVDKF